MSIFGTNKLVRVFDKIIQKKVSLSRTVGQLIILHGLMGGLSNFKGVWIIFPKRLPNNYSELPVYSLPVLNTSVKSLSDFLHKFIKFKN